MAAAQFCSQCGARYQNVGAAKTPSCEACGTFAPGPQMLVLITVFAGDKLLMIRRGVDPYAGKWAPPGGYVEAGESVEGAAARELREEAGLIVDPHQFYVIGLLNVTALNQVHIDMLLMLDDEVPLAPNPPEALDAQWFTAETFPRDEVWHPYLTASVDAVFWPGRSKRFRFAHQTDSERRIVLTDIALEHKWVSFNATTPRKG